jgi:hypothetical protein
MRRLDSKQRSAHATARAAMTGQMTVKMRPAHRDHERPSIANVPSLHGGEADPDKLSRVVFVALYVHTPPAEQALLMCRST